jgi:hypothetical protein
MFLPVALLKIAIMVTFHDYYLWRGGMVLLAGKQIFEKIPPITHLLF